MIERVIYIANDGTEFEDEDECYNYELKQKILPLFEEVQMWDECENPIPTPTCWEEVESALGNFRFIRGFGVETLWNALYENDMENLILDHYDFKDEVFNINGTDLLMFDCNEDHWINVSSLFNEYRRILKKFN